MGRPPPRSTLFPCTTLFRSLLVVTPGSDLRYLSGYSAHAMERLTALAVPRRGEPFLVVPRLEAPMVDASPAGALRSEEHTSELQSRQYLVCRLLLEKIEQM